MAERTDREHDETAADRDRDEPPGDDVAGIEPVDGASEIERSARDAERLGRHSRSFDDTAGANPDRGQQELRDDPA